MRNLLLGATAALACLAPTAANAQTDGFVDVSIGQVDSDFEDIDTLSIGGSVAADVAGDWRAQFDANVTRFSVDDDAISATDVAAHLFYDGGDWAIGGVLANRDYIFGSAWTLGAEGQVNLGPVVLEGELGFGTLEGLGGESDLTNADVNATWYVTPNFSVGAGYALLDFDEVDESIDTWSVDAEYKFASPFSIFAGYSNTEIEDVETDGFRVGGRFAFGNDTLQGRRATGPQWLGVSSQFLSFIS
ncbi:MAG: hypothetical protein AB7O04_02155 [Hyphomonadaceae bacterium]